MHIYAHSAFDSSCFAKLQADEMGAAGPFLSQCSVWPPSSSASRLVRIVFHALTGASSKSLHPAIPFLRFLRSLTPLGPKTAFDACHGFISRMSARRSVQARENSGSVRSCYMNFLFDPFPHSEVRGLWDAHDSEERGYLERKELEDLLGHLRQVGNLRWNPTAVLACNCYYLYIITSEISDNIYIYKPYNDIHVFWEFKVIAHSNKTNTDAVWTSKEERNQCHNFLCWFLGFSCFRVCCLLSCSNFTSS